jgi:hypothetical protein
MMKPIFVARLLVASTCSLPMLVAAQSPPPAPPAPAPPPDSVFYVTTAAPLRLDVLGTEGVVAGGVVKDKPYTADSITESTQILADGNRITHKNQARIYRDSQGRTRREQTMGSLGVFQAPSEPVTMITIQDPVAGATYILDPTAHTARKLQPFRMELDRERRAQELGGGKGGNTAIFERAVPPPGGDSSVAGATMGAVQLPFPPPPASVEPGVPATGSVQVRGVAGADISFGPATVAARAFSPSESVTEDLGEQVLEGVLAHGSRETSTIPAGALGNERAIVITSERWYSPDIDAVVSSKTSDPRFGETKYELVNVLRTEPAPDLFAIPAGYDLQSLADTHPGSRVAAPGEGQAGFRGQRVFVVEPSPKPDK